MVVEEVYDEDNTHVGTRVDDTYITYRNEAKHFYRNGGGYPISTYVLLKMEKKNVIKIVIHETTKQNESNTYYTTLKKYLNGEHIQHGKHGRQRVIPLHVLTIKELEKKEVIGQQKLF